MDQRDAAHENITAGDTARDAEPIIVRTERGLVFAGRPRVSLYDVMDYLRGDYPPRLIADRLRLSGRQVQAALDYLAAHRAEVEREYREILDEAAAERRYWEARNRDLLDHLSASPPPGPPELRERIAALRAKLAREDEMAASAASH